MTPIKGRYFQWIMDKHGSASCRTSPLWPKFRLFIEVIKYEPQNIIDIIKTGSFYSSINIIINMIFYTPISCT